MLLVWCRGCCPAVASYVFECCSRGCSGFAFVGCRPVRPPRRLPQRVLCFGPSRRRGATRNRPNFHPLVDGCVEECSRRKEVPKRPPNSPLVKHVLGRDVAKASIKKRSQRPQYRTAEAIAARVDANHPPRRCARFLRGATRRSGRAGEKTDTSRGLPKSPCAAVSATPTASKRAPRTQVPRAPPLCAARAPPKMFASHR